MNLTHFLNILDHEETIKGSALIFSGQSYPVLFFTYLLQVWNRKEKKIHSIDQAALSLPQLRLNLSMQFLGQECIYWLGNISDEKKTKELLVLSQAYKGPHALYFFSTDIDAAWLKKNETISVELPERCELALCIRLNELFNIIPAGQALSFIKKIYEKNISITLDNACMLLHYGAILSKGTQEQFFNGTFEKIIIPEKSLFSLSSYFFAKDTVSFCTLWNRVKNDYPAAFWIAFWSEHFFKAAAFIYYVQRKDYNSAKRVAHRLPFSFIKQDWKKNSMRKLSAWHKELYFLDYHLKNGSQEELLDIFLMRCLSR